MSQTSNVNGWDPTDDDKAWDKANSERDTMWQQIQTQILQASGTSKDPLAPDAGFFMIQQAFMMFCPAFDEAQQNVNAVGNKCAKDLFQEIDKLKKKDAEATLADPYSSVISGGVTTTDSQGGTVNVDGCKIDWDHLDPNNPTKVPLLDSQGNTLLDKSGKVVWLTIIQPDGRETEGLPKFDFSKLQEPVPVLDALGHIQYDKNGLPIVQRLPMIIPSDATISSTYDHDYVDPATGKHTPMYKSGIYSIGWSCPLRPTNPPSYGPPQPDLNSPMAKLRNALADDRCNATYDKKQEIDTFVITVKGSRSDVPPLNDPDFMGQLLSPLNGLLNCPNGDWYSTVQSYNAGWEESGSTPQEQESSFGRKCNTDTHAREVFKDHIDACNNLNGLQQGNVQKANVIIQTWANAESVLMGTVNKMLSGNQGLISKILNRS